MQDFDWNWRDEKYGCYFCGKLFDGVPPEPVRKFREKQKKEK